MRGAGYMYGTREAYEASDLRVLGVTRRGYDGGGWQSLAGDTVMRVGTTNTYSVRDAYALDAQSRTHLHHVLRSRLGVSCAALPTEALPDVRLRPRPRPRPPPRLPRQ